MNLPDDNHAQDRALWRQAREGLAAPQAGAPAPAEGGTCPDELTLAAYVDGRLGEPDVAPIEAHLSRCHLCAEAVGAAREVASAAPVEVAESVLARAQALVADPCRRPVAAPSPAVIGRIGLRRVLAGVGLAAAMALCATVGFVAGQAAAAPPSSPDARVGHADGDAQRDDAGWLLAETFEPDEIDHLAAIESLEWLVLLQEGRP